MTLPVALVVVALIVLMIFAMVCGFFWIVFNRFLHKLDRFPDEKERGRESNHRRRRL